ncbi:MAG: glycosyltransferase [Treponema sp.]|nr:glycosyltransferase [Treponema sp.]
MKRKFLFLYLNTGAGHISAARVLAKALQDSAKDVEIKILNGFDSQNYIGHILFEKGYNYSLNYFHGAFPLIYDLSRWRFVQTFILRLIRFHTKRYLKELIRKEKPTDIVSFHFALTPFLKEVIKKLDAKINFTVIVTDPFTLPSAWFYEKDQKYFVYSEKAKKYAVKNCGILEQNVTVVPFLLNEKYREPFDSNTISELRKKHGFSSDKKIVLLLGGGEGVPGAVKIIMECVIHHADFSVAVVCGRDKVFRETLDILSATYPKLDLHVFGFIDYLDELVKICDCAVIKAGPATLMEVISCRKPVIIIKYIHNQELGNMRFAVDHHVGWYIRKPKEVYKKINELLSDKNFNEKMKKNFDSVHLDTDASKIARLLLEKNCS